MFRTASTQPAEAGDGGLIGQYTAAVTAGDKDKARQLLREIDEVLLGPDTAADMSDANATTPKTLLNLLMLSDIHDTCYYCSSSII